MPVVAPLALFIAVAALVIAIFAIALKPTEPPRPVVVTTPDPSVTQLAESRQDVTILINRIVDLEAQLRTEKADNFLLKARLSEGAKAPDAS